MREPRPPPGVPQGAPAAVTPCRSATEPQEGAGALARPLGGASGWRPGGWGLGAPSHLVTLGFLGAGGLGPGLGPACPTKGMPMGSEWGLTPCWRCCAHTCSAHYVIPLNTHHIHTHTHTCMSPVFAQLALGGDVVKGWLGQLPPGEGSQHSRAQPASGEHGKRLPSGRPGTPLLLGDFPRSLTAPSVPC